MQDHRFQDAKALNTLKILWFTMLNALFVYGAICYFLMAYAAYKPRYTLEVLHTPVFLGLTWLTVIYALSVTVLAIGILHFNRVYKALDASMKTQTFESEEAASAFFRKAYTTQMFVHLAIFDAVAIVGLVVFMLTLDFSTLVNLLIIASVGFFFVMPSQAKFAYR